MATDDDLPALVQAHPSGTTFYLDSGLHRISTVTPKDGDVFVGAPGAVLSGAILLEGFAEDGGRWSMTLAEFSPGEQRGKCAGGGTLCQLPEDLFIDGELQRRVASRSSVQPGTWFLDAGTKTVYLGSDPTGRDVELSSTPQAFVGGAQNVVLRGLTIQMFATPAQMGAVEVGSGLVIDGCEIWGNHGTGAKVAAGTRVVNSFLHRNGQFGLAGGGSGIVVEGDEIAYNNTVGYNPLWAAGGTKFVHTSGLVVRDNLVYDNEGPGLWTDGDNDGVLYEGNRVLNNLDAGIKHEISYSAIIRDNVVEGNGFGMSVKYRGAGILVRESPDVTIVGNEVRGNADGIMFVQDDRGSGSKGPYVLANLTVQDNVVELGEGHVGFDVSRRVTWSAADANVRFEGNDYVVSAQSKAFLWKGKLIDFADWVAAGNDGNGTRSDPAGPAPPGA